MATTLPAATRDLILSRIPSYDDMVQEDQVEAIIRVVCDDFKIYTDRNLMIVNKDGELIPLVYNWAQERFLKEVLEDLYNGVPVRYIILKARQMGLSTIIEALCFWWTTTHKNVNSVIMAHKKKAAGNLYRMFKRYYDNAHEAYQPVRKYNTKQELVFDLEDKDKKPFIEAGESPPGLNSQIVTAVAKEGEGRSDTIHFLHGSEVAFWDAGSDFTAALLQAVPTRPNTFAFLESTANGVGGYFYITWKRAKRGESAFKPVFYAWHEHFEYELDIPGDYVINYDEEEKELLNLFLDKGYDRASWDRKIMWRRTKKKEFVDDPKKFYQEYPKDDNEAFLASGRPRFETNMLIRMQNYAEEHPSHVFGEVYLTSSKYEASTYAFREEKVQFQNQDPTPLKVWDLPDKNEKYVIGVDVSEGKLNVESDRKENDYSVIDVTRVSDLKTVARWRGHIDPDLLGAEVFKIGKFYNEALVGVEVNNHGLTTVQSLRNKFYRHLYMRETSEEAQFQERTALMGWRTDVKTKRKIIDNLAKAIREGDIIDYDVVFIGECLSYVRDDQGYTNAQEGEFDDTVMAKAISLEMAEYSTLESGELKEKISKPFKRNIHESNSSSLDSIANPGGRRTNLPDAVLRRRAARASHKASRRGR